MTLAPKGGLATMDAAWPTFVVAGAPKSGTTALYHWLGQHPEVYMAPNKQPHFFAGLSPTFRGPGDELLNRDLVRDASAYLALFAPGARARARGEASPFYLHHAARTARRLAAEVPDCRVVVLLRDPVERAYSGYLHLVRDGRESASFAEALEREEDRQRQGWEPLWAHRALGLYGRQLGELLDVLPREQLGVWRYEDLRARPLELYAEVCRFIGVDAGFVPRLTRHNTGGAPRHPGLHALLVRLRVPHLAKRLLPEGVAQWVVAHYLEHRPPPPALAAELRASYASDLAALQRLLPHLDVGSWLP